MYRYIHVFMNIYIHAYMYTYIYTCIHIYVSIYLYISSVKFFTLNNKNSDETKSRGGRL